MNKFRPNKKGTKGKRSDLPNFQICLLFLYFCAPALILALFIIVRDLIESISVLVIYFYNEYIYKIIGNCTTRNTNI